MADDAANSIEHSDEEILRRRAESLATEQDELEEEQRLGVLLFSLGEEWYGVRISDVREIENDYEITPVPCVPESILGVVNVRGEIVSVTDLRWLMGLGYAEMATGAKRLPVIVVHDLTTCTALMVDAIGDIVEIPADAVEPPLGISDKAQADFVSGTFYVDDRLVALVNLPHVLTPITTG